MYLQRKEVNMDKSLHFDVLKETGYERMEVNKNTVTIKRYVPAESLIEDCMETIIDKEYCETILVYYGEKCIIIAKDSYRGVKDIYISSTLEYIMFVPDTALINFLSIPEHFFIKIRDEKEERIYDEWGYLLAIDSENHLNVRQSNNNEGFIIVKTSKTTGK